MLLDKEFLEAVAENGKLRVRIAELTAALKPFADAADDLEEDHIGGNIWESPAAMCITASDLRNCQRLLDGSRAAQAAYLEEKDG